MDVIQRVLALRLDTAAKHSSDHRPEDLGRKQASDSKLNRLNDVSLSYLQR